MLRDSLQLLPILSQRDLRILTRPSLHHISPFINLLRYRLSPDRISQPLNMAYVNTYTPPPPVPPPSDTAYYGPDPYDINFAFPLPLPLLESARIRLTPFIPSLHAPLYAERVQGYEDDLYRYLPSDLAGLPNFLRYVEGYRSKPSWILFAVIDKTGTPDAGLGGRLAGIFGLVNIDADQLWAEITPALVFREYRGTGVAAHATALLLRYCLERPSRIKGCLGLRRVQWAANPTNLPSVGLAEKMGFVREGTLRWNKVLRAGKDGDEPSPEDPERRKGRHSAVLSVCWVDWEGGVRERVEEVLAKK
ncbi:hypothetical protein PLICRDRAFT_314177 [Plicaturopsis crispa FD-325 SS-3]|nr:hypothetical protein PLICRDRAFT_314177 [Plicaturopsis crispa FD-325 SS-3]